MQLEEYRRKYGDLKDYFSSLKKETTTEIAKFDSQDFDLTKLQSKLASLSIDGGFEESITQSYQIVNKVNNDFNVLVTGVGSKIELLEQVQSQLSDSNPQSYIFVLRGYKPLVNVKIFLQKMTETLPKYRGQTPPKQPEQIIKYLVNQPSIIVIIHSIDGKHLLNESGQYYLGLLSQCPNVRMVCSYDNYRYPRICKIQRVFYEFTHTNKPYIQEILQIFEDEVGKQKQEEGLWYVLSSMTQKQKCIVYQFASRVLENRDGLNFQDLYEVMADEMIVSCKQQLKDNLKELMDHNIIIERGGKYTMQFSNAILSELAAKIEQL